MNPLPGPARPGQPSSSSSSSCPRSPCTPHPSAPSPIWRSTSSPTCQANFSPFLEPGACLVAMFCRQTSSSFHPPSTPRAIRFPGHGRGSHVPSPAVRCGGVCGISPWLGALCQVASVSRERRGSCSWSNYHLHVPKAGSRC